MISIEYKSLKKTKIFGFSCSITLSFATRNQKHWSSLKLQRKKSIKVQRSKTKIIRRTLISRIDIWTISMMLSKTVQMETIKPICNRLSKKANTSTMTMSSWDCWKKSIRSWKRTTKIKIMIVEMSFICLAILWVWNI